MISDSPFPKARVHTYLCVQAIGHKLKISIRWNERDGAVIVKTGQAHTLVELDIL